MTLPCDSDSIAPSDGAVDGGSAIAKAARVLRAMAVAGREELGVTDIAERAALPKSTAHRVLAELMAEGLVGRSGKRYQLGPSWFALQSALTSSEWVRLAERARRPLADLFEQTGATVHLGVLDNEQVLYLEKLTARGGTAIPTRVGAHLPATVTALGKTMLAFSETGTVRSVLAKPLPRASRFSIQLPGLMAAQLAQIRDRRIAFDNQESQLGLVCAAMPIFQDGRAIAAMSVSRINARALAPSDTAALSHAVRTIEQWLTPPSMGPLAMRLSGAHPAGGTSVVQVGPSARPFAPAV